MAKVVEAPVDLVEDESGLWTIQKPEPQPFLQKEFGVKVVKFFSPTRICPVHGEVKVLDRDFQRARMHSIEGLSCGHTLLITRQTDGLKSMYKEGPPVYPAHTKAVLENPKSWKFRNWLLSFRETIVAS